MQFMTVYRVCLIMCFIQEIPMDPDLLAYFSDFYVGDLPAPVVAYHAVSVSGLFLSEVAAWAFMGWINSADGKGAVDCLTAIWNTVSSQAYGFVSVNWITGDYSSKGGTGVTVSSGSSGGGTGNSGSFIKAGITAYHTTGSLQGSGVSEGNIPWSESTNSIQSRAMLNRQLAYSQEAYPQLYHFLIERCAHLYNAPQGDTGVPFSRLSLGHLNSGVYPRMGPNFSVSLIKGVNAIDAGVYAFYDPSTGNLYIGSTINVAGRIRYHYQVAGWPAEVRQIGRLYGALTENSFSPFIFAIVGETTNYFNEFARLNPGIESDAIIAYIRLILQYHSQYEGFLLENSIIRAVGPSLNDPDKAVSFPVNWSPSDYFQTTGTECRVRVTGTGEELVFDSIEQAAKHTGVPKSTFVSYLNLKVGLISPKMDHIVCFLPDKPVEGGGPYSGRIKYLSLREADFDYLRISSLVIDKGYVYVLGSSDELIGRYESPSAAAKHFGIAADKALHALNKVPVKATLPVAATVFLAAHWDTYFHRDWVSVKLSSKPVICVNQDTGKAVRYQALQDAADDLGYDKTNGARWLTKNIKSKAVFTINGANYRAYYTQDYPSGLPYTIHYNDL